MLTDAAYFFTIELFKHASRLLLFAPLIVLVVAGVTTGDELKAHRYHGFGPVAAQPVWLQAIGIYLLADFLGYWIHRLFHTGALWPFHAVHHSSEDLDWLSAVRVHPVNEAVDKIAPAVPIPFLGLDPTC
jgi:sterol desaturase/sphingolipid hydroxylase (fatty acid hydroxylase superfamily)